MKMKIRLSRVQLIAGFLIFTTLCANVAHASRIAINTSVTVSVNKETQQVNLKLSIANQGDEPAKEVSISIPELQKSLSVSSSLSPNTPETITQDFSFKELGITLDGSYILSALVEYKDGNFYPFSSPYLIPINVGSPPIIPVLLAPEDTGDIILRSSANTQLKLINTGDNPAELESTKLIAPRELESSLSVNPNSLVMAPGEKRLVNVSFKNRTALVGSHYLNFIVVQGKTRGAHFATSILLPLAIQPPLFNGAMLFQLAIGLLILASTVSAIIISRKQKTS